MDGEIYDAVVAEFERMGAKVLDPDPSIRTNPRMPMLAELEALLRAAYGSERPPTR